MSKPLGVELKDKVFSEGQSALSSEAKETRLRRELNDAIDSSGERGVFFELHRGAILKGFVLAKEEEAEGISGPAVVMQETLEALFFGARLFVDGERVADTHGREAAKAGVIALRAARERVDEGDVGRAEIDRADGGRVTRMDEDGIAFRGEIKLLAAVGIEIQARDFGVMLSAMDEAIGDRLGAY